VERMGYRIRIKGKLSERFVSAFEGLALEPWAGETVLVGQFNPSQLHGLLERMRDLGLELLSVEEVSR
jgi:hypothetical protein